jgi:SNF2 family DNA or RNA helicase
MNESSIPPARSRRGDVVKSHKEVSDVVELSSEAEEDSDSMEVDDEELSAEESTFEDDDLSVDDNSDESEVSAAVERNALRTSSRSNKFKNNMIDPPESPMVDSDDDDKGEENRKPSPLNRAASPKQRKFFEMASPQKSPAQCHVQRRRSLPPPKSDKDSDVCSSENVQKDSEPLKVQRILASRTMSKKMWREVCKNMNTSEIHNGSGWFQDDNLQGDENDMEERFLVKWSGLSFLHTSWETQCDLFEQINARAHLKTFMKKAVNDLLYSPDERGDGDYFDPSYTQIDRILSAHLPEDWDESTELTIETEESWDSTSFGMILDNAHPEFVSGTGRQFLIKWCNLSYSHSTYEFERDLLINQIDYKNQLRDFLSRQAKPSTASKREAVNRGEEESKRLHSVFGDQTDLSDADRAAALDEYKQKLRNHVYKNGGQLRDYQAEGVAWMIANFINHRGCILADEMGLGKVSRRPTDYVCDFGSHTNSCHCI